ncbi:MAG: alpha/beta hydrolase [Propionicimonas sp.]
MQRRYRGMTAGLVLALAAGCTFPSSPRPTTAPTPSASSPATTTPRPGTTDVGGVTVSDQPGKAIDRPTLAPEDVRPEGFVDAPAGSGLRGYLDQEVVWETCGDGTECADIVVPLDYANPSDQAITLSLKRRLATESPRLGSLFLNPGGPGGPGKDMVETTQRNGLEGYDLIGWDPRGTGDSTPVQCFSDKQADAYNDLDFSPDTERERADLVKRTAELARSCWEASGELLGHISTIETVRDLDLMRHLVGDEKLHYLGYSYGTQIGATYAELFPSHVGRLVLDAAVNITENDDVIQAMGFDLALGNFAAWCPTQSSCPLGESKQEVLDSITALFDKLDSDPIAVGERRLTQSLAMLGVAALLYGGTDAWPTLVSIIEQARRGNGRGLLWAGDQLNARNDQGGYDTMFYAFPAISCLDSTDDGVVAADTTWREDQQKAPIFGKYFGPQYACALWPTRPAPQLTIRGAGAPSILVIGGKGDNATPYQQAVAMAQQLESGVLVTYTGEGHGTYGGKSACVDKIVVKYLVNGTVPKDGVTCS